MLMTLYEGGFRPGEICQLTWGDLKSDSSGIAVNVNFKTGITRYIRLVMAKKYIRMARRLSHGNQSGIVCVPE